MARKGLTRPEICPKFALNSRVWSLPMDGQASTIADPLELLHLKQGSPSERLWRNTGYG